MRDRCHWLERGAERVDVIGPDTVRSDVATAAVQPKVADLLTAGLAHHQAGRLHEAELEYRAVLALSPVQAEALYLLGVVAYQCARPELALELIGNAIQQNGSFPAYHTSYGLALQQLGRLHGALESHDRALALVPGNAEALNNRGLVLQELERFDEALESYDRALAIKPDLAMTLINRGNALRALHRLDEAVASYDRALALEPNSVEATYNRNNALKDSQLA
jgi:tetratricopeptide (TPR) repeat protein